MSITRQRALAVQSRSRDMTGKCKSSCHGSRRASGTRVIKHEDAEEAHTTRELDCSRTKRINRRNDATEDEDGASNVAEWSSARKIEKHSRADARALLGRRSSDTRVTIR